MWLQWRRLEKVSRMDRITDEKILQKVNEEAYLIRTITQRKKKWIGHVMRGVDC